MPLPLDDALKTAVAETFENMAFVESRRLDAAPGDWSDEEQRSVTLRIHEPFSGGLQMICASPLLNQLASDIYALPGDEADPLLLRDLQAEILNTIAGRFLTHLLPDQQPYRLGLPAHAEEDAPAPQAATCRWWFEVQATPFLLLAWGEELLKFLSDQP